MINKINEYKNITAPKELKSEVLELYKNKRNSHKVIKFKPLISAVAAVLAIILVSSSFLKLGNTTVTVNGMKISEDESLNKNRSLEVSCFRVKGEAENMVPVAVNSIFETDISVSSGEMNIFNAKSAEFLYMGKEYSVKENVIIQWILTDTESEYIMKIKNRMYSQTLKLEYDEKIKNWNIINLG